MSETFVLDGVRVQQLSNPNLYNKLSIFASLSRGDTRKVSYGSYGFVLKVEEVSEGRIVLSHIGTENTHNSKPH